MTDQEKPEEILIRRATMTDCARVVKFIDNEFTKDGFGFVNRAQIQTETEKGRVFVAFCGKELVGVRIGIGKVWNLVVSKPHRGQGIGRKLIEHHRPHTIRVKADPVGHLSKKQREEFVDPSGFYEALGFKFWGRAFPKNFWQRGKDGKAQFHAKGKKAHIKIYVDDGTMLF